MQQADIQVVELSGEHPNIPAAEVMGVLRAWGVHPRLLRHAPRFLTFQPPVDGAKMASRLALARHVGRAVWEGSLEELAEAAASLDLGGARFRLRVEDFAGTAPADLEVSLGEALAQGGRVDLETPEVDLRLLVSLHACLYRVEASVDRAAYEERRPAGDDPVRPVTIHPRLARALVNLASVREGETLLDPFCGAGGILLEAGLVGAKPQGSDVQSDVLETCGAVLHRHDLAAPLVRCDVGEIAETFGPVDAVATDPPYGRSAGTRGEKVDALLGRAFEAIQTVLRPGGRVAIALPSVAHLDLGRRIMDLKEWHALRVHRSLTRTLAVFERR